MDHYLVYVREKKLKLYIVFGFFSYIHTLEKKIEKYIHVPLRVNARPIIRRGAKVPDRWLGQSRAVARGSRLGRLS